jgi:signal transduction histidine kinase
MADDWQRVLSRDGTVLARIPTDQAVREIVVDALPLRRVPTDVRALLESALGVMRRQANALDVTLDLVIEGRVPAKISLDAEKTAWAITTLVGNALRYVHHGSHAMPGGTIKVHVTYDAARSEIAVKVQDDGAGIPAEKLQSLFSLGADQPRAGLSLPMIRDVVRAHGGEFEVQSETNPVRRGTTIRFTLPVS